jgi:hypothetical protein
MVIRIQPSITYNHKTSLQNRPNGLSTSTLGSQHGKNITFGEDSAPPAYTLKNALIDLRKEGKKVEGDTPNDAFKNFVNSIREKLKAVDEKEKLNARTNWEIPAHVEKELPFKQRDFVVGMSKFVQEHGAPPKLVEKDLDSTIENHITKVVGIKKPGFFGSIFDNEFSSLKLMMKTACDFLKEGLITIKNVK